MAQQLRVGWRPYTSGSISRLLDTYPGAAAAYSIRKLSSSYTGYALRVRRSADNTSLDIGFDSNGNLDTESLLNFVGYKNNFLVSNVISTANGYGPNGVTYTQNWLTGPDGVTPSNRMSETATNAQHFLSYSIISGTIDSHNVSGYLKKGTGSAAPDRICISVGNSTYGMYAIFNLTTGLIETQVAGTATNFEVKISAEGNGFYRCSVGGKLNYSTNQSIRTSIQFCNNSSSYNPFTTSYVGNVNADVQMSYLQWTLGVSTLQRYGINGNAGDGYVSIWYDQSGNGYNRTQPTSAQQPQIVSSGSIMLANGKPSMYFNGTNTNFIQQSPAFGDNNSGFTSTIFSVTKLDPTYATNNEYPIFGGIASYSTRFSIFNNKWYLVNSTSATPAISSVSNVTTNQVLSTVLFAPTDKVRINGSEVISGNAGVYVDSLGSYIGRSYLSKYYKGYFQEHIIYLVDKTSDFSTLESGINTYYSIY